MLKIYQYIASILGVGYIPKGGGTVAAAIAAILWYIVMYNASVSVQITATFIVFIVGVYVSNQLEKYWGKDSSKIVIDEVLGMMLTLVCLPVSIPVVIIAFVLFRFFDIAKPLGIRMAERLPQGWGVMVDDLWAGAYANIIMQVIIYFEIL